MALSRTLRFQVLRRDNHTCRYCGRCSPSVKLTVDHVQPVALGGTDDPGNLVTACEDCNGGKSATPPDAATVEQVDQDAIRWAQAIRNAAEQMAGDIAARDADRHSFQSRWNEWQPPPPLQAGWRESVDAIRAAGLPLPILLDCIGISMRAKAVKPADRFRYACGVAWKRVAELQQQAKATLSSATPHPDPVSRGLAYAEVADVLFAELGDDGTANLAEDATDELIDRGHPVTTFTVYLQMIEVLAAHYALRPGAVQAADPK